MNYQYKIEFCHRENADITFCMYSDSLKFVINYLFALKELFTFTMFVDDAINPFVRGGTYLTDKPFYVIDDMFEFLKGISFNPIVKEYEYQL